MPTTHGGQKHFSQFLRIDFRKVILCAKITEGVTHHLACIGVAAEFNFASDELLEVLGQCHLHGSIFPRRV